MSPTVYLLALLRAVFLERRQLLLENLALRQQVAVLRRGVKRVRLEDRDRIFWIGMRRLLTNWQQALMIVKPETVIRWHRKGWKYYWRRKSKPHKPGRPPISFKLIHLIRRMSMENATWGAPRIQDELALLGHEVAASTVARYMVKARNPKRGQAWTTFIRNHLDRTVACDFFTVPTLAFKTLYVFVVLGHARRRILHVGVTTNPTAEWAARRLVEALPGIGAAPDYLVRDRDSIYGHVFQRQARVLDLREMVTQYQSPWQNAYCERVIGTLRRECTDHVLPMSERHLTSILREYVAFYNEDRPHQGLDGDAPDGRAVESEREGEVIGVPVLGGLHHRYTRAAA